MTKQTAMLTLWLTEEDKENVRMIAHKNNVSMSGVGRIMISNGVKNFADGSPLRLI